MSDYNTLETYWCLVIHIVLGCWLEVTSNWGFEELLSSMSGHVEPENTLAIMGSSGSGKTTFLNIPGDRISSGVIDAENLVGGGGSSKRTGQ